MYTTLCVNEDLSVSSVSYAKLYFKVSESEGECE